MKKLFSFFALLSFVFIPVAYANDAVHHFHGEGEVTSVDPAYSRVTIEHAPIKGFPSEAQTDFSVQSASLLKNVSVRDLVSFDVEETKGDAQIVKIERTGQAPPKEEGVPLGQAAQGVLDGAGAVVKTVTSPIAPVSEAAGNATSATSAAVGSAQPRVDDGAVESKTKF